MSLLILIAFILSFSISILIIALPKKILINESDLSGVQKLHIEPTARLGGIAVFISFSVILFFLPNFDETYLFFWISSIPVFFIGLLEDLTGKIAPSIRLFFMFISIYLMSFFLDLGIDSLGFEKVDFMFQNYPLSSLIFSLLMISGAINSINIIDGMNGLKGGYAMVALSAIVYVAFLLEDILIIQISLLTIFSILGFFVFNFPFGKIFMGDGGAYFVGFILAFIGLLFVERNEELSNWFVLLIFIYPMYELLFSMLRRKFVNKSAVYEPDALHLHTLIYRQLQNSGAFSNNELILNSLTSPFLWFLSLLGIIPAVIWFNNKIILIFCACIFMLIYTIIYKVISSKNLNEK